MTYTGKITKLEPNQIFVFGSNTEGRHGKGAALFAKQKCGAIYGQASGPQGQSYAIVTKDLRSSRHPSIAAYYIANQISHLYDYCRRWSDKQFVVAYNAEGNNLNGYSPEQMAIMFATYHPIPANLMFEVGFKRLMDKYLKPTDYEHTN